MADKYAAFDLSRLAFNGADGATTITDEKCRAWTLTAGATLSVGGPVYGATSLVLDGTTGASAVSDSSTDWNFGVSDYRMGCYVTFADNMTRLFGCYKASGMVNVGVSVSAGVLGICTNELYVEDSTFSPKPLATHYVELKCKSGVLSLWVDGGCVLSQVTEPPVWTGLAHKIIIGEPGTLSAGSFDQFRVSKGTAGGTLPYLPPLDGFNEYDDTNVTLTNLGTYTRQVTAVGPSNPDAIIAAADKAIQQLGWVPYDSVYNGIVTKVYRCLNADGVTYKTAVLLWDKIHWTVTLTSCESWNLTTKAMVNECWSNARAQGECGWGATAFDLVFFGGARWLGMMSYQLGNASQWAMCVEVEREAEEDTAVGALPCWGMIYSPNFLYVGITATTHDCISFPRTKDGSTGVNAARNWTQITSYGAFGPLGVPSTKVGTLVGGATKYRSLTHQWDTAKKLVSAIKLVKDNAAASDATITQHGRIFGAKVVPYLGNTLEQVYLPIDADGFYSAGGAASPHWILPTTVAGALTMTGTGATLTSTTGHSLAGAAAMAVCCTGQKAYVATFAHGIVRVDLSNGTVATVVGTTGLVTDVVFDGRYVYGATDTGIVRIDTCNNDALTSLTGGVGGTCALAIHNRQFLYASQRTASTTPTVYKIDLHRFAMVSSNTLAARTTASVIRTLDSDGDNFVVGVIGNTTTAADLALVVLKPRLGSASYTPIGAGAVAAATGVLFTGKLWQVAYGTGAASSRVVATFADPSVTTSVASMNAHGGADTASEPFKFSLGRIGMMQFATMPCSVTTAHTHTNSPPPDGAPTLGTATIGNLALTTPLRVVEHTGNLVLAADTAGTLSVVTNLYRGIYNSLRIAQTLIPR